MPLLISVTAAVLLAEGGCRPASHGGGISRTSWIGPRTSRIRSPRKEDSPLVGNPGTGKTHVATALGVLAARAGYRVRFWRTSTLVNDLIAAQQENRLGKFEKAFLRPHLVILDELGFITLQRPAAELLFQLLAARHERGSLAVTSNLDFKDWTRVFGDETLTAALLDRLTHNAHILVFNGPGALGFERWCAGITPDLDENWQ